MNAPQAYAYANGNPLRYVDPDGRLIENMDEGALAELVSNAEIGSRVRAIQRDPKVIVRCEASSASQDARLFSNGGAYTEFSGEEFSDRTCCESCGVRRIATIRYDFSFADQKYVSNLGFGVTLSELMAHELGHASYELYVNPQGSGGNSPASNARSLYFENAVRRAAGHPLRTSH